MSLGLPSIWCERRTNFEILRKRHTVVAACKMQGEVEPSRRRGEVMSGTPENPLEANTAPETPAPASGAKPEHGAERIRQFLGRTGYVLVGEITFPTEGVCSFMIREARFGGEPWVVTIGEPPAGSVSE